MAHNLNEHELKLVRSIQDHLQGAERDANRLMRIQKEAGHAEEENDVFSFKAAILTAHAHGTDRLLHMCDGQKEVGDIILEGHR